VTIIGGRAERGGGMCNDDGMLSLTDGNIDHSFGRRFGGGLFYSSRRR
jgi:hypothetical protein